MKIIYRGINQSELKIYVLVIVKLYLPCLNLNLDMKLRVVDVDAIPYKILLDRDFIADPHIKIDFGKTTTLQCVSSSDNELCVESDSFSKALMLIDKNELQKETEIFVNENLSIAD